MAYLHCHTSGCHWEQDDFWDFTPRVRWRKYEKRWWKKIGFSIGYNPVSRVWSDISWLLKPRWLGLDDWIIKDMTKYTGVNVKVREITKVVDNTIGKIRMKNKPDKFTVTEKQVFSWQWMWLELVGNWKNIKRMKWPTWKGWKKVKDTAVCPKCGEWNFDID